MQSIHRLTSEFCKDSRDVFSRFIYESMNFGVTREWYSMDSALSKCDDLMNYLEKDRAICYYAEECDNISGFIWAYPHPNTVGDNCVYVSILYVKDQYRGYNIGSALLHAVEDEAKQSGYDGVWLHTGGENIAAQRFYDKMGFKLERVQLLKSFK